MCDKESYCKNCGACCSFHCDWMGISIDYDDICKEGHHHTAREVNCDCEQRVLMND